MLLLPFLLVVPLLLLLLLLCLFIFVVVIVVIVLRLVKDIFGVPSAKLRAFSALGLLFQGSATLRSSCCRCTSGYDLLLVLVRVRPAALRRVLLTTSPPHFLVLLLLVVHETFYHALGCVFFAGTIQLFLDLFEQDAARWVVGQPAGEESTRALAGLRGEATRLDVQVDRAFIAAETIAAQWIRR